MLAVPANAGHTPVFSTHLSSWNESVAVIKKVMLRCLLVNLIHVHTSMRSSKQPCTQPSTNNYEIIVNVLPGGPKSTALEFSCLC